MENDIKTEKVQRIHVLKVPVDVVEPDSLKDIIESMAADGQLHHITFLTLWDFMRARRNREYAAYLETATLVLPVSTGIVRGAHFLKKTRPVRYLPYDFVIRILGILEEKNKSVYLFGASRENLQISERKVRQTFPGIRIVGRYAGRYRKQVEHDIIQAMRKASPTLLLAGNGVYGKEKWIRKNKGRFSSGILLWGGDCFEIFAERHRRISRNTFKNGLEFLPGLITHPWRIARSIVYFYYLILLVIYRIRKL